MPAGLTVAIAAFLQVASDAPVTSPPVPPATTYGPAAPAVPRPKPVAKAAEDGCGAIQRSGNARDIIICAQRPDGYRLNPDVLEAKREMKSGAGGRPHNPHEMYRDQTCSTVGPMGCRGQAGINLVAAAITAATMAKRLAKGQEIGSMFETDPHPSEYQLYVDAKHRREAREAEAAAKAAAKAKAAQAASSAPTSSAQPIPAQ